MQKGHDFEKQVEKVLEHVEALGGHAHKNHPARTAEGTYLKGEPYDYEAFLPEYKCVFDAKKSATDTWRMLKKDVIQANNLMKCANAGLHAYFLICFENREVRQIDIREVVKVLQQGKKSIPKKLGQDWELLKIVKGGMNKCLQ